MEESVKRFERSNGLDTALYKTIPLPFFFIISKLTDVLSISFKMIKFNNYDKEVFSILLNYKK